MSKSQDELKGLTTTLLAIDVNEWTKKKGKYTYLSWSNAVTELLKIVPDATWEIHEYEGSTERGVTLQPYMRTDTGYFVKVTVTVRGISRTQIHPVLDNMNNSVDSPNSFHVNTAIQRCLAKAIGLHGLGLYIYAGEDLPEPPKPLSNEQKKTIDIILSNIDNKSLVKKVKSQIKSEEINDYNYKASVAKLEREAERFPKLVMIQGDRQ